MIGVIVGIVARMERHPGTGVVAGVLCTLGAIGMIITSYLTDGLYSLRTLSSILVLICGIVMILIAKKVLLPKK